jgi:hypothetical protein
MSEDQDSQSTEQRPAPSPPERPKPDQLGKEGKGLPAPEGPHPPRPDETKRILEGDISND